MRFLDPIKMGERSGQSEMRIWVVSVGLDGTSKPCDRLIPTTQVIFRGAGVVHPKVSQRIARAEPQGLQNVIVRVFSAANVDFTQPGESMGKDKISIQRQGVRTFGDALCGSLGHYVDVPQYHIGACIVRD